jgi:two-component sensor histidine kinase
MAPHSSAPIIDSPSLALAVIACSTGPLVLLDGNDLTVIAVSQSFCRAFEIDSATVPGGAFSKLGAGEWDVPQLTSLLRATAVGYAAVDNYEMDLCREGHEDRRLVLNVQKLDYRGSDGDVRLLLSASDITDARMAARLKEEMLKERTVLLQEMQHRVANSLQIIASVLMHNARQVQSSESRSHLLDAHKRLMSVAALQRQLAASAVGDVELRPYFKALCDSISASMIRDRSQLTLEVSVDDSITPANVSVSLGLIVTELLINALKHAFPGDRKGKIEVNFKSRGANWKLSVIDNGIGMPTDAAAKPGLGSSIVQALAAQLHASVEIADARPGTAVSIVKVANANSVAAARAV